MDKMNEALRKIGVPEAARKEAIEAGKKKFGFMEDGEKYAGWFLEAPAMTKLWGDARTAIMILFRRAGHDIEPLIDYDAVNRERKEAAAAAKGSDPVLPGAVPVSDPSLMKTPVAIVPPPPRIAPSPAVLPPTPVIPVPAPRTPAAAVPPPVQTPVPAAINIAGDATPKIVLNIDGLLESAGEAWILNVVSPRQGTLTVTFMVRTAGGIDETRTTTVPVKENQLMAVPLEVRPGETLTVAVAETHDGHDVAARRVFSVPDSGQ